MIPTEKPGTPEELVHHGVKGMKWGVQKTFDKTFGTKTAGRRPSSRRPGGGVGKRVGKGIVGAIDNTLFEIHGQSNTTAAAIRSQAVKKLKNDLPGIKARHGAYGKLTNRAKKPFSKEAKAYRKEVRDTYLKHLESSANSMTNTRKTRQFTLKENGQPNTSQYFWKVSTQSVSHADDESFTVHPIFDDEGYIIDIESVEDSMAQTIERGRDFLIHMGLE